MKPMVRVADLSDFNELLLTNDSTMCKYPGCTM